MTSKLCNLAAMCIDPGWNVGCTLVSLDPGTVKVVSIDVIETKPLGKKSGILKADDDWHRGNEVWQWLEERRATVGKVAAVFVETTAGGKGSRALFSMGYNKSLADCYARHLGAPAFHVSAQAVKKAATGRLSATKEEVQQAMMSRIPHINWKKFKKSQMEHAADSAAIFLAGWKLQELQAMLRMIR